MRKNISNETGSLGPVVGHTAKADVPAKANSTQIKKPALLNPEESKLLKECEKDIDENLTGWCVVGFRLWQIRERGLYRTLENRSFEDYLDERWDYSKAHANRLIKAHLCVKHLDGVKDVDVYVPTKEAEVRYISNLPPDEQVQVAHEVQTMVGDKRATAEDFSLAREKLFPTPKKPAKIAADAPVDQDAPAPVPEPPRPPIPLPAIGSNLEPIAEIQRKLQDLYNIFVNPTKKQEGLKLIGKIQRDLREWEKVETFMNQQEVA
jgi:hypothetical protein